MSLSESTALTATLPSHTNKKFAALLVGTRHVASVATLDKQAKLFPLLNGLPPPGNRSVEPLPKLDAAALAAFELMPMAPAPAAAASDSGLTVHSAAPSDPRFAIWELSHQIHEVYSNEWPHKWQIPTFPHDKANPQPSEWMPWADQLLDSAKAKEVLTGWRDTPTTGQRTREALESLMQKLKSYNAERRKRKAEQEQATKQQNDLARAEQIVTLGDEERRLEMQQLQQRHGFQITGLEEELGVLTRKRPKDDAGRAARDFEASQKQTELQQARFSNQQEMMAMINRHQQDAHAQHGELQRLQQRQTEMDLEQQGQQMLQLQGPSGGGDAIGEPQQKRQRR